MSITTSKRGRGPGAAEPRTRSSQVRKGQSIKRWTKWGFAVLGLVLILRTFVMQGLVIRSDSMNPTLLAGDVILVDRAAIGANLPLLGRIPGYSGPHRFDIVIFELPGGRGTVFAKRLIGMPGDTIVMRDNILYINGDRVEERYVMYTDVEDGIGSSMSWQIPYLTAAVSPATYYPTLVTWGPLVIPARRYFVLGDRRDESLDSRTWGFVEARQIKGRVAFIYFSYDYDSEKRLPFVSSIRWERVGRALS